MRIPGAYIIYCIHIITTEKSRHGKPAIVQPRCRGLSRYKVHCARAPDKYCVGVGRVRWGWGRRAAIEGRGHLSTVFVFPPAAAIVATTLSAVVPENPMKLIYVRRRSVVRSSRPASKSPRVRSHCFRPDRTIIIIIMLSSPHTPSGTALR